MGDVDKIKVCVIFLMISTYTGLYKCKSFSGIEKLLMTDCVADPQYIKFKAPLHKIIYKSSFVIKEMQLR